MLMALLLFYCYFRSDVPVMNLAPYLPSAIKETA